MPEVVSGRDIGGLVSPPSIESVGSGSIQMSLLALDKLVSLGVGGVVSSEYYPHFDKWNAVAKCNVPLLSMKDMFVFQSDHYGIDDLKANDVRFYIDASKIPSVLNLNTAVVNSGAVITVDALSTPLPLSDMVISRDYIKHLADILFNTPYGADLFVNESDLVTSVDTALTQIWTSCASDLQKISITGNNPNLVGSENHKYLLGDPAEDLADTTNFNICRELFRMLLSRVPVRFTNLPLLKVPQLQSDSIDTTAGNLYYLPLQAGDQILMRVVLTPSTDQSSFQESITKDAEVRADKRAYIIALNLV
jgi:hypothetical protein